MEKQSTHRQRGFSLILVWQTGVKTGNSVQQAYKSERMRKNQSHKPLIKVETLEMNTIFQGHKP